MIEVTTYKCEICGKTFDDEDDCHKHEMEHTTSLLKKAVVMMDSDGEILSLDDMPTAIERADTIYVECKETANILWGMFEEEGCCVPIEDIDSTVKYPAFFIYDQDHYRWRYMRDLEEEYNCILELKTAAENALLS